MEIVFQVIILDIDVVKVPMVGKSQFKALQYEILEIELNTSYGNEASICFGSKLPLSLIDIIQVFIPVGTTSFYIINTFILFFLCLKNIDTFNIYLNNITN